MLTRSKAIVTRPVIPALAVTILVSAWSAVSFTPASRAYQATPAVPVVITSEVLGRAKPAVVDDAELALGRVTIMPGAAIPIHYHVGTQIGVVVQGELTYTFFSGAIAWHRGDPPD